MKPNKAKLHEWPLFQKSKNQDLYPPTGHKLQSPACKLWARFNHPIWMQEMMYVINNDGYTSAVGEYLELKAEMLISYPPFDVKAKYVQCTSI